MSSSGSEYGRGRSKFRRHPVGEGLGTSLPSVQGKKRRMLEGIDAGTIQRIVRDNARGLNAAAA